MGRLAQAAFADLGSAGGHKNMARAEIPLANLEPKLLAHPPSLDRFIQRRLAQAGEGRGRPKAPAAPKAAPETKASPDEREQKHGNQPPGPRA
jgi:hypothetical protein